MNAVKKGKTRKNGNYNEKIYLLCLTSAVNASSAFDTTTVSCNPTEKIHMD